MDMVVLGDSLSSAPEHIATRDRWHDLLADRLAAPGGVRTHFTDGVGGFPVTTRGGTTIVDHWDGTWGGNTTLSYVGQPWLRPPMDTPFLLLVAMGANDIAVGATPDLYAAGLSALIESEYAQHCVVVFPWWPAARPSASAWATAAAGVAASHHCGFVNVGAAAGAPVQGVTSIDDIHPTTLGHQKWFQAVLPVVLSTTGRN